MLTIGGGPSSSGYGSGAPGGGREKADPIGGDGRSADLGGGEIISCWSGVLGGRGGGSKLIRGEPCEVDVLGRDGKASAELRGDG